MNSKFLFFLILIISLCCFFPAITLAQKKLPDINNLLLKGDSLLSVKKVEAAKNVFKSVLKIDKRSLPALSNLGKIAVKQQNWGEAKDRFGEILNKDPENLEAHYYRGICYRETGKFKALLLRKLDWNKSKKHFLKIIQSDSLYKDVFFQFARLKRYREKYEEAIQLCQAQIRLRPELEEPQVKFFRFYRYFITHNKEKEVVSWLKKQSNDEAKYAIGETLRRSGKLEHADSIFQSLLKKPLKIPRQPIYLSLARINSKKKATIAN